MRCDDAIIATGAGLFLLYLFDQSVGGLVFRCRLWLNNICFYHGAKKYGRHLVPGGYCEGCDNHYKANREKKVAALEARRKLVTGQSNPG